jgi:hypothetical protein
MYVIQFNREQTSPEEAHPLRRFCCHRYLLLPTPRQSPLILNDWRTILSYAVISRAFGWFFAAWRTLVSCGYCARCAALTRPCRSKNLPHSDDQTIPRPNSLATTPSPTHLACWLQRRPSHFRSLAAPCARHPDGTPSCSPPAAASSSRSRDPPPSVAGYSKDKSHVVSNKCPAEDSNARSTCPIGRLHAVVLGHSASVAPEVRSSVVT